MADSAVIPAALDEFFRRWEASGAAERADYSMFLNELCDLLEVPRPDPAGPDDEKNAYVFERAVPFPNPDGTTTVKLIDLYKRDCFVLEAKQGSNRAAGPEQFTRSAPKKMKRGTAVHGTAGWDAATYEANGQAELYVRNLPASEHNPPFIAVVPMILGPKLAGTNHGRERSDLRSGHGLATGMNGKDAGRAGCPCPTLAPCGREGIIIVYKANAHTAA